MPHVLFSDFTQMYNSLFHYLKSLGTLMKLIQRNYHSIKAVFSIAFLSALLTGCGMTGSTSFQSMSTSYREVLEGYANDNILLNVIRASEQLPMSFLDMPSVIGSGSISASVGVSSNIMSANPASVGGFFSSVATNAGSYYAPSAGMGVNNSFNFTQSSLDNQAFMQSFLSDLKPEDINSLTNNRAGPKSILYSLVIENVQIRDGEGNVLQSWDNDPTSPRYAEFQRVLYRLIDSGLKTEVVSQREVLSGPISLDFVSKNLDKVSPFYTIPNVRLVPIKDKHRSRLYEFVRITPVTRMCLIKNQREENLEKQFSDSAFCNPHYKNSNVPHNLIGDLSKPGVTNDDKHTLAIKLRSPRNIYSFLGSIVSLQLQPDPKIIKIKNSDFFATNPSMVHDLNDDASSLPLFEVYKNNSSIRPISMINYRGSTYAISADRTSRSREVLVLLSEILTLSKVPGSIPASPAVLIN